MSMLARVNDLPLPTHVYIPGKNTRHKEGFLDHIIELAPETTKSDSCAENIAWHFGLRLLREGFYWEAHEVLEAVWMNAPHNSQEKFLVQGIIHIANARLKALMDLPEAEKRLLKLAEESVERAYSGSAPLTESGKVMNYEKDEIYNVYEL